MERLEEIQNETVKCSCCGKEQMVKDMKYKGIQEGIAGMTYSLALYNCQCRSTQCIKISREVTK